MADYKPEVYVQRGLYDEVLPPYTFEIPGSDGRVTDEEMFENWLGQTYDDPDTVSLDVLEIGAGTGRMSALVAPYAGSLVCADNQAAMLESLRHRVPTAETLEVDTYGLASEIGGRTFDLVGAFWTLSYPIGERLETITDTGITPRDDFEAGVKEARGMIDDLVGLAHPDGKMIAYFFDSESPEQQAVTEIWEQVAPDPGGRRSFTREVAEGAMEAAAEKRGMSYEKTSFNGVAEFENGEALREWYRVGHCKSRDFLVSTRLFNQTVERLMSDYRTGDGDRIELPVGMHVLTTSAKKAT